MYTLRSLSKLDFNECVCKQMIETNKWTTLFKLFQGKFRQHKVNKKAICQIAWWCYWNSNSIDKFAAPIGTLRHTLERLERKKQTNNSHNCSDNNMISSRSGEWNSCYWRCACHLLKHTHSQLFQSILLKMSERIEWNNKKPIQREREFCIRLLGIWPTFHWFIPFFPECGRKILEHTRAYQ